MNIKELSVGDWVMYRNREWQVCSLYQFTGEVGLWRKDSQICENVADLTPIPLTPEILEKNGFTICNGCTSRWELEYRAYWVKVTAPDDYSDVTIYKKVAHGYRRIMDAVEITSVPELQHALRLAGIEKEIEL